MNSSTITVHWHDDNQPVYSVDFQPNNDGKRSVRVATGGGDNNVRLWKLVYDKNEQSVQSVEYLCTLAKHTQAVNVVRFDPKGEILATAGDDGTILIWTLSDTIIKEFGAEDDEAKESWVLRHACRSSTSEIYDLAWSPDSQYIITGSMDNVTRIYSSSSGQQVNQIAEHSHYVQGVAWDPKNEFIATQSADRSVHIYSLKSSNDSITISPTIFYKITRADLPTNRYSNINNEKPNSSSSCSSTIGKLEKSENSESNEIKSITPLVSPKPLSISMNPPSSHKRQLSASSAGSFTRSISPSPSAPLPAIRLMEPPMNLKNSLLYHNETLQSFFRRLTFSPDGSLLLTPSGIYKTNNEEINTVYVYTRSGLNHPPVLHLPGLKKPAIAISFSPLIYKLRLETLQSMKYFTLDENKSIVFKNEKINKDKGYSEQVFKLPYRMIYAVATQDSILLYDTQQKYAIGYISNLHYSTFTDLSWDNDGKTLIVSSTDGFCSTIVFTEELLGEVLTSDSRNVLNYLPKCEKSDVSDNIADKKAIGDYEVETIEKRDKTEKRKSDKGKCEISETIEKPVKEKPTIISLLKEDRTEKKKRKIAPTLITK